MDNIIIIITFLALFGTLILLKIMIWRLIPFFYQFLIMTPKDLTKRYGKGSWVLITGASSGMGRRFAIEFAKRGFNLILIGSQRTLKIVELLDKSFKNIEVKFIEKDFSKSYEDDFFDEIEDFIKDKNLSIVVNNVGYRIGWEEYENKPFEEIKKTVAVGTLPQCRLIQLGLKKFIKRNNKNQNSCIINITAQCCLNTDLFSTNNSITIPHLSCYEGTNAFGYFHAKSIYEEIRNKYDFIDFLNITPGAVKTQYTKKSLENVLFSIDEEPYVNGILALMGNLNGNRNAYWGHEFSILFGQLIPEFYLKNIFKQVGLNITKDYRKRNKL